MYIHSVSDYNIIVYIIERADNRNIIINFVYNYVE